MSVPGEDRRAARRQDVGRDDQPPIGYLDAVFHVKVIQAGRDGSPDHGGQQHSRDDRAEPDEDRHRHPTPARRFERPDGERDVERQNNEGEQQIQPGGSPADGFVDVPLQTPPNESLVQLVGSEQERKGRDREVVTAMTDVPGNIDSDDPEHHSAYEVGLRRETH